MGESRERGWHGSAEEIPPPSTCDKNPNRGERRIFPSETVREKQNGKVGQQDKWKHYSEERKAGYQEADAAD